MDFFDKLGKKATEAYKVTADKTGKIAKETKLKFKIGELRTQISDMYEEIGKKVYEKHVREENDICIKKDLEEQCTKIDVLSDEIDGLLKQCLELKNKKQCPKCYKEIEKDDKFCSNCGEKQTNDKPQEEEVLEKLENTEVAEEKQDERQIVIEELEQSINEKEEKSNNKKDKKNKNKEKNNEEKSELEKTVEVESNPNIEE